MVHLSLLSVSVLFLECDVSTLGTTEHIVPVLIQSFCILIRNSPVTTYIAIAVSELHNVPCLQELQTVQGSSTGKGRLTSLTGLISDTSTKLRLKKPDPEFAKQLEYLESFSRHLSVLEGHTSKMFEERKGMSLLTIFCAIKRRDSYY